MICTFSVARRMKVPANFDIAVGKPGFFGMKFDTDLADL